jgi:hypothetical protein
MKNRKLFLDELTKLINRCCLENESNTPDFILAQYLASCLEIFNSFVSRRDRWYGIDDKTKIKVNNNLTADK